VGGILRFSDPLPTLVLKKISREPLESLTPWILESFLFRFIANPLTFQPSNLLLTSVFCILYSVFCMLSSAFSAGSARDNVFKSFSHAQSPVYNGVLRVRRVHRGRMFLPWFRERLIMANPQTLRVKFLLLPRKGHEVWTEFISLRILATSLSRLSQRSLRALREIKTFMKLPVKPWNVCI